jgi:hypothetical protein
MASTDIPNAPVTPQEVPRKLSQRDRETAILFYLTPRVKAAGCAVRLQLSQGVGKSMVHIV